jgi:hypothetical protein
MIRENNELGDFSIARQEALGEGWVKMLKREGWYLSHAGNADNSLIDILSGCYAVHTAVVKFIG